MCRLLLAQALETRSGDMQRQLLMAQSDLKAAHADAHMQDMATAQLEAQLAGLCSTVLHGSPVPWCALLHCAMLCFAARHVLCCAPSRCSVRLQAGQQLFVIKHSTFTT